MFSFAFVFASVLAGCTWNRHYIDSPGTSQAISVESGDRLFMDLEEDSAAGCRWYGRCVDPDVDVVVEHEPGKGRAGAPGTAEVAIRVGPGYDGPSAVTFVYKRPGAKQPLKKFTITLYRSTSDRAFWK